MKYSLSFFLSVFIFINISFAVNIENNNEEIKHIHSEKSIKFFTALQFQTEKKYVFIVKKLQNISKYQKYSYTPQFIVLAFDGSYSLSMWEKTRKFAQEMKAKNIPVRFTYFISGVYFIPENLTHIYDLYGYRIGHSDIGWGDDLDDITKRIHQVNNAYREGHEIGSHANGHFDGSKWTVEQWGREFDYFNRFLFPRFDGKYPELDEFQKKIPKLFFDQSEITGFRAPLLGHDDEMYSALSNNKFTYETNKVYAQKVFPKRGLENIWEMPLASVKIGGRNTISMDYNLYYLQTKAKSILLYGTPEWEKAYNEALKGYLDYFYNHYENNRAPIFIGHHFSTWNDGLYWEVMKGFAREVCGKKEVVCGTNKEVEVFLERN